MPDLTPVGWRLLIALIAAWAAGVVVGQLLYFGNRRWAFRIADALDRQRKGPIRILHRLLPQPWGVTKGSAFIFVVNLFGGSLFQHSILGSLIVPPFLLLFTGGLLVGLLVRRYPERFWITALVCPFEFGAFAVAATGGVSLGLTLWGLGDLPDTGAAFSQWARLFLMLVVPLQLVGAVAEAVLARRLPDRAWPHWLFDDET